mmetsp:Transcript_13369/g.19100  ORF Transcript_13369/g.19100 Transcript_13369/m.19100 type:complete len:296 (+) Transcript_13369:85-972(+)
MNSSDVNERPFISPGSDVEEPAAIAMGTYGPVLSQSYSGGSRSSSGMIWLLLLWFVLILLVVGLVYVLVECRCRNQNQKLQQDVPETHDVAVAVAEPVVAVEPKHRKIDNLIGLTILYVGSFIGLGLSIFSISTCEFASLASSVTLDADASLADGLSLSIHNLGLLKVDLTSNFSLSGCVNTDNLPFLDTPYNFAKASAIMGAMFGGMGPLVSMYLLMKPGFPTVKARYMLVTIYSLGAVFQLATLSLFGSLYCKSWFMSGSSCSLSIGAVASVSAALYWMLEAIAAACLPFNNA